MPGDLDFGLTLSKLDKLEEVAPVPGTDQTFTQESSGLLGAPEYRWRFTANWYHDRWSIGWRTSYIGEMLNDDFDRSRQTACQEFNNCHDKIALFLDGVAMHNLRVGYDLEGLFGAEEARLFFGVNNIGNEQGPVLYGLNDGINDGDVGENHHKIYDITGIYYYAGATFHF